MRDELDLRLVDVAAFHASQSPVLIARQQRGAYRDRYRVAVKQYRIK
jgi:hypothetical protein